MNLSKSSFGIWLSDLRQKAGRLIGKATIGHWLLAYLLVLVLSIVLGSSSGLLYGLQQNKADRKSQLTVELMVQMNLAQMDMDDERYHLARQRIEFIIGQDPGFPGVQEKLVEAIIGQTTSLEVLPTIEAIPSPTPDPRAANELFAAAQAHQANREWSSLLDTLISLRSADPNFEIVQVDRMLNLALRMGGAEKIINEGNLEGGLYNLTLAEGFAPLDQKSNQYREWARLYLIGASFWNVSPEQAVNIFSQLILSAPYLRDQTGLTSTDRYRLALIQFGDKLAGAGEWCAAQEQYDVALSISAAESDAAFKAVQAAEQCANPSGATATMQEIQDANQTPAPEMILSATQEAGMTPIPTLTPDPAVVNSTPTVTNPATVASSTVEKTPEPVSTTAEPGLTQPTTELTTPAPTQETTPAPTQ